MRGYVPTPIAVVDQMVERLFASRAPRRGERVLDPGCGPGGFIDGVLRWCDRHGVEAPRIVGVELDPGRHAESLARFRERPSVEVLRADFLRPSGERFDYVIGNPPYVSITGLSEDEKTGFRRSYETARGRFDLYQLFFEQALSQLRPGGRLVFLTPEKFLYVSAGDALRRLLARLAVEEIILAPEDTFHPLLTYPAITVLDNAPPRGPTTLVRRDGSAGYFTIPRDGSSMMPLVKGHTEVASEGPTLEDLCVRISCGVATGADDVFVRRAEDLGAPLRQFAHPTISGRQLAPNVDRLRAVDVMLIPYDDDGVLLPYQRLGALQEYLGSCDVRPLLEARTCARRKPWYAFHDSVPFAEMLRPKILCKDVGAEPRFWVDHVGDLVPRHSVYYLVPTDPSRLDDIAAYLNGPDARSWLLAHCQRAANDFIRLQSAVLKRLPVPTDLLGTRSPGHRRRRVRVESEQLPLGLLG